MPNSFQYWIRQTPRLPENQTSLISLNLFQADLNNDGLIDWDEFVQMMMPEGEGEQTDYASAANKHPADATTHPKTNK